MGDGTLIFSAGSSRSGKSLKIMREIAKKARVVVWDEKDEYARNFNKKTGEYDRTKVKRGWKITRTPKEFLTAITTSGNKFKICHVPDDIDQFDYWCRVVYAVGKKIKLDIVAEELADVTSPGKAPAAWGNICRKILGFGCNVYAVSQRPAESDKTALGNATIVRTGRLNVVRDRKTMAEQLGVDRQEVADLAPFEFIERNQYGEISRGKTAA